MKRWMGIALGPAILALGLLFAVPAPMSAQVSFYGSFPLPHGRIAVGVPGPLFRVGAFVPPGYAVILDPTYGYGFYYGDQWIPCERDRGGWIVAQAPYDYGVRPYRAAPRYRYGYSRYGSDSHGYARPYRTYERGYRPYTYSRPDTTDRRGYSSDRYSTHRSDFGPGYDRRGYSGRFSGDRGTRGSHGSDSRSGRSGRYEGGHRGHRH